MILFTKHLISLLAVVIITSQAIAEERPNIVFFIVDDQERSSLNSLPQNSGDSQADRIQLPTPNLDSLATNGVTLNNLHVPSPVCIPSRFVALTGTYGSRAISDEFAAGSWKFGFPWVAQNTKITHETDTILHALKKAGYRNGAVGKNHVIEVPGYKHLSYDDDHMDPEIKATLAHNEEIQEAAYRQAGFDYAEALYFNNPKSNGPAALNSHNMDWITLKAFEFIEQTKEQPFFLYYATTLPHDPYGDWETGDRRATPEGLLDQAPNLLPPSTDIARRLREAGMSPKHPRWKTDGDVVWIDDALGALVQKLEDEGVLENTIILYFNDHGMEGDKTTVYQGGLRSMAIVNGPEKWVTGKDLIDNSLTSSVDFGRTILGWADALEHKELLDGVDLAPLLEGKTDKVRETIYGEIGISRTIRKGDWKYIALREPNYLKNLHPTERQRRFDKMHRMCRQANMVPFPNELDDPFAHIAWLPGGWSNTWPAMEAHPHYFDVDQLYNLADDPGEKVNLANNPLYNSILLDLKKELSGYLATLPGQFGEF